MSCRPLTIFALAATHLIGISLIAVPVKLFAEEEDSCPADPGFEECVENCEAYLQEDDLSGFKACVRECDIPFYDCSHDGVDDEFKAKCLADGGQWLGCESGMCECFIPPKPRNADRQPVYY